MAQLDIVSGLFGGLFGQSPDQLRQTQQQQMDNRAMQLAQLSPGRAGVFYGNVAGQRIGKDISAAFGVQDPAMQRRQKAQQIVQSVQQGGLDPTSAEGLLALAQALDQFPEFAQEALQARQAAAAKAQQALANRLTEAKIGAEAAQAGKYEAEAAKALREPPAKEDRIKTPPDFAAAGISLGIPSKVNIADYTQEETARIRQQLQKEKESTAKAGVAPSDKDFGNATALRENFLKETKDIDTGLKALYNVQQLLSERSGLADAIAKRQFAKFSGDRDISNKDIQAFGNFGSLGQRLEGILSQFFSGKYSEAQVEEASRIASNLLKNLQQNRSAIEQQYRTQAEASKIEPGRINFVVPSFTAPTTPKERLPVPANIAQQKGWKTGQKVKRGNKTYTFDGTQLIED